MDDTEKDIGHLYLRSCSWRSLTILWEIPDYVSLPDSSDFSLTSPSFNFGNATWCFKLNPGRVSMFYDCFRQFSLVRLRSSVESHDIIIKMDIMVNSKEVLETCYGKVIVAKDLKEVCADACSGNCSEKLFECTSRSDIAPNGVLKLRCQLLSEESEENTAIHQNVPDILESSDETTKGNTKISFKSSPAEFLEVLWRIPNFSSVSETPLDCFLESETFRFAKATWCLRVYPNGKKEKNQQEVVSLVRVQSSTNCHDIFTKSYAYDSHYSKLSFTIKSKEADFPSSHSAKLWSSYRGRKSKRLREYFAPNDTVILEKQIFYHDSEDVDATSLETINKRSTLCQDMKKLLLNGQGHDLTLKVKNKKFPVHQNILRVRSQVFKSMLSRDMTEENDAVLDVPDCDPEVMEQLLLYIYCDKVDDLNEDNMLGLYHTADKFDMMFLKEDCHNFIKQSLTPSNFYDVIRSAINHNDDDLRDSVTKYFANNTNEILHTEEWMKFLKSEAVVANELLIEASKKWTDAIKMLKMTK